MTGQPPASDAEPPPAEAPAVVRIKVREHGPLLVTGPIELFDHEGNTFPTDGPNIALCRCGGSARKPFCDGTHRGNGFDGTCARQT